MWKDLSRGKELLPIEERRRWKLEDWNWNYPLKRNYRNWTNHWEKNMKRKNLWNGRQRRLKEKERGRRENGKIGWMEWEWNKRNMQLSLRYVNGYGSDDKCWFSWRKIHWLSRYLNWMDKWNRWLLRRRSRLKRNWEHFLLCGLFAPYPSIERVDIFPPFVFPFIPLPFHHHHLRKWLMSIWRINWSKLHWRRNECRRCRYRIPLSPSPTILLIDCLILHL